MGMGHMYLLIGIALFIPLLGIYFGMIHGAIMRWRLRAWRERFNRMSKEEKLREQAKIHRALARRGITHTPRHRTDKEMKS